MRSDILSWLAGASAWSFQTALWLFLGLNLAAMALLAWKRDRALINRWTSHWLALNLGVLALGAGVPAVAWALRLAVSLLPSVNLITTTGK